MLPVPFKNYIPDVYVETYENDEKMQALCTFMDNLLSSLKEDILNIVNLQNIFQCPEKFLSYLDFWLNAGILDSDTERQKRNKIFYAISTHKNRGLWEEDVKIRIDTITGYDADVFSSTDNTNSVELANQTSDPDYYWSSESANAGLDENLGTWEIGFFNEYILAAIIAINCHVGIYTAVLSSSIIEQIVSDLEKDFIPAYFTIQLGYENSDGQFIQYSNGEI